MKKLYVAFLVLLAFMFEVVFPHRAWWLAAGFASVTLGILLESRLSRLQRQARIDDEAGDEHKGVGAELSSTANFVVIAFGLSVVSSLLNGWGWRSIGLGVLSASIVLVVAFVCSLVKGTDR